MVEAVTRAKGLLSLARELGFQEVSNVVQFGTYSSAAKSEVQDGKLEVSKVPGESNPADLMTRLSNVKEIRSRLGSMNIEMQ
eukprot:9588516-Karenia_brevis.AAC.1